ncbi:MAG: hypothetical protein ACRDF4_08960, partial [Rhabdochlamydiaceae bacterium]
EHAHAQRLDGLKDIKSHSLLRRKSEIALCMIRFGKMDPQEKEMDSVDADASPESSEGHGESQIMGLILKCEICGEKYVHEFKNPIATKCTHCDSVFDGRLQIVKAARKDFQAIVDRF